MASVYNSSREKEEAAPLLKARSVVELAEDEADDVGQHENEHRRDIELADTRYHAAGEADEGHRDRAEDARRRPAPIRIGHADNPTGHHDPGEDADRPDHDQEEDIDHSKS